MIGNVDRGGPVGSFHDMRMIYVSGMYLIDIRGAYIHMHYVCVCVCIYVYTYMHMCINTCRLRPSHSSDCFACVTCISFVCLTYIYA